MLHNYLLVAARHLRRAPGYTLINILGLSVGIAACLLIAVFVRDELGFDRHHEAGDRIVRVVETRSSGETSRFQAVTPPALAGAMKSEIPHVMQTARLYSFGSVSLQWNDVRFEEPSMVLADSTIFDVFTLRLVEGDPRTALTAPNSIIISESIARKVFGDETAMGKELVLEGQSSFTVTGVVEDQPRQSHIDLNLLGSFQTIYQFETAERLSNWRWQQFFTYALLREASDAPAAQALLDEYTERVVDPITAQWSFSHRFQFQPLSSIYLDSAGFFFDYGPRGSRTVVWTMSGIGVFILLIACFNFMNLATARSLTRSREVGLRKVVGAQRSQLINQFLFESGLVAALSLVPALLLTWAGSGWFSSFTGKPLQLDPPTLLLMATGSAVVLLLVGGLAGLYPALYLSSFRPSEGMRGSTGSGKGLAGVRRGLVVAQFAIGIALMAGTVVIYRQLGFIQNRDIGYDRELLVRVSTRDAVSQEPDRFIERIRSSTAIVNATHSWGAPGAFQAGDGLYLPEKDESWPINMYLVDDQFLDVYQMEIMAGRSFDPDLATDRDEAFILNETAAAELAPTPELALGKEIHWDRWDGEGQKMGRVVGVVQDFNYESVHREVAPLVIHLGSASVSHITVRLSAGRTAEGLQVLETAWSDMIPDWPLEYRFVDEALVDDYRTEQRMGQIMALFSLIAVLIAALGLFALASFTVERRLKEIGIRKVLGATPAGLTALITREFLVLVCVAFLVGAPLAWLGMNQWLNRFAYRIEPGPALFLLVGAAAIFIAVATVGSRALMAAQTDPVRHLRA